MTGRLKSVFTAAFLISAVAPAAAALNRYDRGWQDRGNDYAGNTSRHQLETMRLPFAEAKKHVGHSFTLTAKPTLSYDLQILLGMHDVRSCDRPRSETAPHPCLRAVLDRALNVDPKAYWLRRNYLTSLQPRWGGSFAAMEAFAKEVQSAALEDWQRKRLHAMVFEEKARVAEPDEKLKLALNAYELNHSTWNITEIIRAMNKLDRHREILPYATRGLELSPDDRWMLSQRGSAYEQLGKPTSSQLRSWATATRRTRSGTSGGKARASSRTRPKPSSGGRNRLQAATRTGSTT